MGREVRMVPENYQHPRHRDGKPFPLRDNYSDDLTAFEKDLREKGVRGAIELWCGAPPSEEGYMLVDVPASERTHFMMFENTSEGTPISPAFKTLEELAKWLADNKASACGSDTATYEQWLAMCKRGSAVSMVYEHGEIKSGVAASMDSKCE